MHPTPTRRLIWRHDPDSGHWLAAGTPFSLRREAAAFGTRGWALWQSATRLSLHDTLQAGKAAAARLDPARVNLPVTGRCALACAALGQPAPLPVEPFARTVEVVSRLLADRGPEEGFDEAMATAYGADPLVLRQRRDEVIAAAQRRHAELMAA